MDADVDPPVLVVPHQIAPQVGAAGELVRERQELRSSSASLPELERNRLAIVRCQWELSQALIARHLVPATAA
jgi:hypothetical protein